MAILMWGLALGSKAPIFRRYLKNWDRIRTAFGWDDRVRTEVLDRLSRILILDDYRHISQELGPSSLLEFSEERSSLASPQEVLDNIAGYYLVEPK